MSSIPIQPSLADRAHLAARTLISAVPMVGGPALELFNAAIAPPIERRRNEWLNDLAERLLKLEQAGRLSFEELAGNEAFVSAVMDATLAALRTHEAEKREALRNAVLNCALDAATDAKRVMFLLFAEQFTVWHLRALRELARHASEQAKGGGPATRVEAIAQAVMRTLPGLSQQPELAKMIVEDLCRRDLVYSVADQVVTLIPRGTRQVTPLGEEFLRFISEPTGVAGPGEASAIA